MAEALGLEAILVEQPTPEEALPLEEPDSEGQIH
jgi:hypothetical protein